jgi:hypothetical protein
MYEMRAGEDAYGGKKMNTEQAIETLIGFSAIMTSEDSINAFEMALSALHTQQEQEKGCKDCTGILYRQTNSGKIIPADNKCVAITPPCYQADGDGCAYQIYGDYNDEPIDKCKACPLCNVDKIRHTHDRNSNSCKPKEQDGQWRDEDNQCDTRKHGARGCDEKGE